MAQSKLRSRAQGPYEVIQARENVIVVKDGNTHVPISIDRCSRAPDERLEPSNPNDGTHQDVITDNDVNVTPHTEENDTTTDARELVEESNTHEIANLAPYVVRIVDHTNHLDGEITFHVQMSDTRLRQAVPKEDISHDMLLEYYESVTNPKKNPHLRRRGRPPKERGARQDQQTWYNTTC